MRQLLGFISLLCSALLALPTLAQEAQPIAYNVEVSGEISEAAPEQRYTFSGSAGDVLVISMTATGGGLDSYVSLRDAADVELAANDDSGGQRNSLLGPYQLPADGTYTVVATRCCGVPSGPGGTSGIYTLLISTEPLTMLTLGGSVGVELNAENPVANFAIDGAALTAGAYSLNLTATTPGGDASIDVRDAQGWYLIGSYTQGGLGAQVEPVILSGGAFYAVTVLSQPDPNSGEIEPASFTLTFNALEAQPFSVGDTLSGTLDGANPSDIYTFDASPAQLLQMSGSQGAEGLPFEAQVFAPSGMSINYVDTSYSATPGSFVYDPLQTRETGTYYLLVRRLFIDGVPIPEAEATYSISLGASNVQMLQSGVAVNGTIEPDIFNDTYAFDGRAGQRITLAIESANDTYAPSVGVEFAGSYDSRIGTPAVLNLGGALPGSASYSVTLPSDGLYLVRVSNGFFYETEPVAGSYTLTIMLE
jgi:uncharacterized protein YdeI (BOF family)